MCTFITQYCKQVMAGDTNGELLQFMEELINMYYEMK
jgi:hypothetical protein